MILRDFHSDFTSRSWHRQLPARIVSNRKQWVL